MLNIYDNGEICLGEVKHITEYVKKNGDDLEECEEILKELENLEDDTIVAINYDNGMGYSFDYWEQSDKVKEMN